MFSESFDKASVEYASAISKSIDALKDYLNMGKAKELLSFFGTKDNHAVLETQLAKLGIEAKYLHDRLTAIISFNGASVDRDNIANLESKLNNMKIYDIHACDAYFTSDLTRSEMGKINIEIDAILQDINTLKGEIGKYNSYIQDKVKNRKDDINEFLSIAGFKYTFDVEINGENNARALLKFVLPDGETGDLESSGDNLSWGEKHAFALILFMFDAIRRNAELVILDDPISSFDNDKKYAITNRLFKTGNKESLYQMTVLMLTHDFEPVIDYIQTGSGRQDASSVCATYFENINGQIRCSPIKKDSDLMSSVVLLKELARDTTVDIVVRIGSLRKFIEHQHKNPRETSEAYNVLSSLIHGRSALTCCDARGDKLTDEQKIKGSNFIKKFIPEFDYAATLEQCDAPNLLDRYSTEGSSYIKMLILRAYTERNEEARERLRKTNDALRKYVDETHHIENDYIYSLDVRRFDVVPDYYLRGADLFMEKEGNRELDIA